MEKSQLNGFGMEFIEWLKNALACPSRENTAFWNWINFVVSLISCLIRIRKFHFSAPFERLYSIFYHFPIVFECTFSVQRKLYQIQTAWKIMLFFEVSTFFCCGSLRTGGLTIGYLSLINNVFWIALWLNWYSFAYSEYLLSFKSLILWRSIYKRFSFACISVPNILVTIAMLYGIHMVRSFIAGNYYEFVLCHFDCNFNAF